MTTFQERNETSVEIANLGKLFLRKLIYFPEFFNDFSKCSFYCQVCFHNE